MKKYTLDNGIIKASFLSYGAIIHELWVKDKYGIYLNVVKGLSNLKEYLSDTWSRGAVIGRFAGRLENPIQIEGEQIAIENQEGVMLHSGSLGWNKRDWSYVENNKINCISFEYYCKEGAGGFPGNVKASVSYSLIENELFINYRATTDAPTHVNLTNHSYFNLSRESSIDTHQLQIKANQYLELKENLVPTGKILEVSNTPFDFRSPRIIGKKLLDDYFILNHSEDKIASLYNPHSGIEMQTYTSQPGIVVFTPPHFEGICFETQKFSNTPNIQSFPSTLLKPDEVYDHNTRFKFIISAD